MAASSQRASEQKRSNVQSRPRANSSAARQAASFAAQPGTHDVQAAVLSPGQVSPAQLLEVQRRYGNRAVQRLLDSAAPADVQDPPGQNSQTISRASLPGSAQGGALDSRSQSQIESARGGGSPLDGAVGAQVGDALGADFSGVKVHTDPRADALNRSLSARAFTTGSDIFFSRGAYQPGSSSGKQLLAHELTHVVQQGSAKPNKLQTKRSLAMPVGAGAATRPNRLQFKLTVGAAHDRYEQEADRVANAMTRAPAAPALKPMKRAVTKHAAHAAQRATSTVQRYTDKSEAARAEGRSEGVIEWTRKYQRTSAGGGIIQVAEQKMFASDTIIDASEAQLAAQGSYLQLVKEGGAPHEGYSWVKVKFRGATERQKGDADVRSLATENARTPAERRDNLRGAITSLMAANALESDPTKVEGARDANKSMAREESTLATMTHPGANDLFLTVRDCHRTARTIMGDLGITNKAEHMVVSDTDGAIKKILPDKSADKEIYSTDGQTGAVAFLKFAFSKFGAVLRGAQPGKVDLLRQVDGVAAAWNYNNAMTAYQAIQADPEVGPLFNTTFKVNDHARVAVGQALVQVNDENERASSVAGTLIDPATGKKKDLWNFHWAGIVLMDGADYVTLQAVADAQATGLTVNWWFKMYGAGAQSFHSEEKQDSHVGSRPLTMGVSAEAPARAAAHAAVGGPARPLSRIQVNQLVNEAVKEGFLTKIPDSQDYQFEGANQGDMDAVKAKLIADAAFVEALQRNMKWKVRK